MLFTLIPVGDVQPVLAADRFGYGEAESGRFLFLVPLVETFEDMLFIFLADADAAVFHRDHQQVLLSADQHIDRSAFMIIFDGIADEIADELLHMLL